MTGGADAGGAVVADAGDAGAAGGNGDGSSGGGEPGGGAAGGAQAEPAFVLVATQRNDASRTSSNLNETALDTSNVRVGTFGELARRPLRGATFAQPLVAPSVELGDGSRRDLLVVATMANVVYALDARQPERPPIWARVLGSPVELPTSEAELDYLGIWHEVGILGTPVLSVEEGAVYAVAATRTDDVFAHTAYKLDLATGGVLKSTRIESDGFVPAIQAQRAALTLTGGVVYVPFGPYTTGSGASGWVFAFDSDLTPLGHVNLGAPSGAGVTMAGDGPAVGGRGSLFFTTGVGAEGGDTTTGYGVRVLELDGSREPELMERLLPEAALSGSDELASSGPLLLPGSDRLLVAGQHRLYVVDAQEEPPSAPLQTLRVSGATHCASVDFACDAEPSSPAFWPGSGPTPVPRVFVWSPNDLLRSFALSADLTRLDCGGGDDLCRSLAAAMPADAYGAQNKLLPESARLSVSSSGEESGSGIVWALQPFVSAEQHSPEGILRAFDAEGLGLLWSSELAKEQLGPIAQGALPTVSGGRVFVGTADGLSHKSTFWDSPAGGPPALANYDDELLVLAWPFATPENQGFQLAWSSDGVNFDGASTLFTRFGVYQSALAADGRRLYMAWTTAEQGVNVVASDDPSFAAPASILDDEDDSPFDGRATSAPALAYGGGQLFLAAHTEFGLELVSSDDGATFDPASHLIFAGYTSASAPLLAYEDGKLYLVTSDYFSRVDLFLSSDGGANFDESTRLPMLAAGHPALLSFDDPEPAQVLVWTNAALPGEIEGPIMAASRYGAAGEFERVHRFRIEGAERAISSARFQGSAYIAWMGIGGAPHPNVARYTPGGLVTYGLRDP